MSGYPDNYDVYYADKLWNLLPAVYRAQDTDQFGANGPLRELVNRVGAQAANIRRSIDRMWEDQSIETCDDWVIPYIGDLLNTNLVGGLDPRGQRIDVAKTIYYRRRKGTVAILEEIAANITGWDAKVVEFFRRMGRTRHLLDPAIGAWLYHPGEDPRHPIDPPLAGWLNSVDDLATLQVAEGLAGSLTQTGIGGFADLRNVYGATKATSAFDEFFHTADIRAGLGTTGWYNIPHLGVFLWRLVSYPVGPTTPVPVTGCPGWYCFDPTGRDIPLFAPSRSADAFGANWVSPVEAQMPTPISQPLFDANTANIGTGQPVNLYPDALAVYLAETHPLDDFLIPVGDLTLRPQRGRFAYPGSPPLDASLVTTYHYGFPSDIGAGPYDRRIDTLTIPTPAPAIAVSGGGTVLAKTGAIPAGGTLTILDSLTCEGAANVTVKGCLTLRADNQQRPLIRLAPGPACWTITGTGGCELVLDGLFVAGNDILLSGSFASVTLSCCTLDPGSSAASEAVASTSESPPATNPFALAADGRDLAPTRLWIEATVSTLTADRCVLASVRTRNGGLVETVAISNSILQAIPTGASATLAASDIMDPERLEQRLLEALEPNSLDAVANRLMGIEPNLAALLGVHGSPPIVSSPPSASAEHALLQWLNDLIVRPPLYDTQSFKGVPLSTRSMRLLASAPAHLPAPALNRSLLADAFPLELSDAALAFGDGMLDLSRCTVIGRVVAHQAEISECILWDLAQVDNAQNGCTRFSAWANGSILPRKYECVTIPQQAPLFTSIDFGQPGYGQLRTLVDASILPDTSASAGPPNTISAGAEDGSEMGAYARDKNPIKQRGLLIKYQEYMPAGLNPVIVYAT